MYHIEKFRSEKNKEYYFRGVAENGKTVFSSEGYNNKKDRDRVADKIQDAFDVAKGMQSMRKPEKKLLQPVNDDYFTKGTSGYVNDCIFNTNGNCGSPDIAGMNCMHEYHGSCPVSEVEE